MKQKEKYKREVLINYVRKIAIFIIINIFSLKKNEITPNNICLNEKV